MCNRFNMAWAVDEFDGTVVFLEDAISKAIGNYSPFATVCWRELRTRVVNATKAMTFVEDEVGAALDQ